MKFFIKSIIFFSFIFFSIQSFGQSYKFSNNWSCSLNAGTTSFFGDMKNTRKGILRSSPFSKYFYEDRKFMTSISLDKDFSPYFGLRLQVNYGNIQSTKESEKIYFKANLLEYGVNAKIDFTNIFMGQSRTRIWNVYGMIGIGATSSHSWIYQSKTDSLILSSPLGSDNKFELTTNITFPIGIGFQYMFNKNLGAKVEINRYYVSSDELDNVISDEFITEGFTNLSIGIVYKFEMPSHIGGGGYYNPSGKSNDAAIKAYNKNKRVIMKTPAYKKSQSKRYNNGSTLKRRKYYKKRHRFLFF